MLFKLLYKRSARYVQEFVVSNVRVGSKYFHMLHKFEWVTHLVLEKVEMLNASDLKAIAKGLSNILSLIITNCTMVRYVG